LPHYQGSVGTQQFPATLAALKDARILSSQESLPAMQHHEEHPSCVHLDRAEAMVCIINRCCCDGSTSEDTDVTAAALNIIQLVPRRPHLQRKVGRTHLAVFGMQAFSFAQYLYFSASLQAGRQTDQTRTPKAACHRRTLASNATVQSSACPCSAPAAPDKSIRGGRAHLGHSYTCHTQDPPQKSGRLRPWWNRTWSQR
jgi:hypothetical protein